MKHPSLLLSSVLLGCASLGLASASASADLYQPYSLSAPAVLHGGLLLLLTCLTLAFTALIALKARPLLAPVLCTLRLAFTPIFAGGQDVPPLRRERTYERQGEARTV